MRSLQVWMNGEHVATWSETASGATLDYLPAWLQSPAARPLSLSLPLLPAGERHRGSVVVDYFDNLLPDSTAIRQRLRDRFRTRSAETFALLEAIGRDCVGAVQLLPSGTTPDDIQDIRYRRLSTADVERVLHGVTAPSAPGRAPPSHDEFRISIAGAQEKTGLLLHEGTWCIPEGSTPSTHIFKLPLGLVGNMRADMQTSAENEWLCLRLLAAFGIPVTNAHIGHFGSQRALVVERFDRRLARDGRWWIRVPQEDMCQVFGLPSSRKYESDGGPGILKIMDLLRQSSNSDDRATFFKTQILFWLLAATDGHAKNFSVQVEPHGRFHLTPIYDVLSVHPILGRGPQRLDPFDAALAMGVQGKNRHRHLNRIRRRHWNDTARACGIGEGAEPWIVELLSRVEPAIAAVASQLPDGFPLDVSSSIFQGLRASAARLASMPPDA